MYPIRQHFNLLKPISESDYYGLEAYLKGLFDKPQLVAANLIRANDDLEFDVNCIQQSGSCRASFTVAVSGASPSDRLFDVIVERFKRTSNEIYVIGEPGSGALNLASKGR